MCALVLRQAIVSLVGLRSSLWCSLLFRSCLFHILWAAVFESENSQQTDDAILFFSFHYSLFVSGLLPRLHLSPLSLSVSDILKWIVLFQSHTYWSVDMKNLSASFTVRRSTSSTTCCLYTSSELSHWAFILKYSSLLHTQTHMYTHIPHTQDTKQTNASTSVFSHLNLIFSGALFKMKA